MIEPGLQWLLALMDVPSVSPLEGGDPAQVPRAQRVFAEGALALGAEVSNYPAPPPAFLANDGVPVLVQEAARADPAGFLAPQHSTVATWGRPAPAGRRLVVNFHVDTVGPHVPPQVRDGVLYGRGAVDDKGPGVAAAVGIAAAFAEDPSLADRIQVVLASVPGEEGGAMGSYGTRWLVERGVVGRLMIFAEPTGGRVMDACTAAMTARWQVSGNDSTDDHPEDGHNATLALGFVADRLVRQLGPVVAREGGKLCVGGLHTGTSHNRVYGSGQLLVNIAYPGAAQAGRIEAALDTLVAGTARAFDTAYAGHPLAARTARDWDEVVQQTWLKRGLPVLANRDPAMEDLLAAAGAPRHDGLADGSAFTCDAIWAAAPGRYVAVCGPGRLDANGAHTPGEQIALADLSDYARTIKDVVSRFGAHVAPAPHTGRRTTSPTRQLQENPS